jgi:phosphohistidine phosphatase
MRHTLLLLRHAEATATTCGDNDFDRPLSHQGEVEAVRAANWLNEHNRLPDHARSSAATRARQTAGAILGQRAIDTCNHTFDDRLYLAGLQTLLEILAETSNSIDRLLLVGHNPGLTHLLGYLSPPDALPPDRQLMTPASIALITFDSNWSDLNHQCSSSCELIYPP